MGMKGMAGRLVLLLGSVGTGLWITGCSADNPGEVSAENGEAGCGAAEQFIFGEESQETAEQSAFGEAGQETAEQSTIGEADRAAAAGQLHVVGAEGALSLTYRASCPDGIHYRVEIHDENGGILQELACDIPEDFAEIRNGGDGFWLYADSLVRTEDANGDGSEDLWLYQGTVGTGGYDHWACYLYDGETAGFDRVEGFEELRDPYVDMTGYIESDYGEGASKAFWEKYSIRGNQLVPAGKLAEYCIDNEGILYVFDEEVYEDGALVSSRSGVLCTEVENTKLWERQLEECARQVIAEICKNMQVSPLARLSYGETEYGDWDEDGIQDATYILIVDDPLWPPGYSYIRRQTRYGSGDTSYVEQGGKIQ